MTKKLSQIMFFAAFAMIGWAIVIHVKAVENVPAAQKNIQVSIVPHACPTLLKTQADVDSVGGILDQTVACPSVAAPTSSVSLVLQPANSSQEFWSTGAVFNDAAICLDQNDGSRCSNSSSYLFNGLPRGDFAVRVSPSSSANPIIAVALEPRESATVSLSKDKSLVTITNLATSTPSLTLHVFQNVQNAAVPTPPSAQTVSTPAPTRTSYIRPQNSAYIILSTYYAMPQTNIAVSGWGFAPGETVAIEALGTSNSVVADDNGQFATNGFTVESSHIGSTQLFRATGQTSGVERTAQLVVGDFYPFAAPSSYYIAAGNSVSFTGRGFMPGETITLASSNASLSAQADPYGNFSTQSVRLGSVGDEVFTIVGSNTKKSVTVKVTVGRGSY